MQRVTTPAEAPIPDELASMLAEGRVIPFIGAGFSLNLGLPSWHKLLREIYDELEPPVHATATPLKYERLSRGEQADPLQLAEYLFLRAGADFGPILYRLSRSLFKHDPVETSTPHIELANLSAPLVYTTNYDDLIERTYRTLGREVVTVIQPRDLAGLTADKRLQVVKYHGDLQYESSIVFTQRQYYSRLGLDSPIDIKLRADLFGRSVLFLGYGFQDINIRLIWFKLMEAMRGVPERRRPTSYIVLFKPDPLLEALYQEDGIHTIVLTRDEATPDADAFSRFMVNLSVRAASHGWHNPQLERFVSPGLLDSINDAFNADSGTVDEIMSGRVAEFLGALGDRIVPSSGAAPGPIREKLSEVMLTLSHQARAVGATAMLVNTVTKLASVHMTEKAVPGFTYFFLNALLEKESRGALRKVPTGLNWRAIWNGQLRVSEANEIVIHLRTQLDAGEWTEDVPYAAYVVRAIADPDLIEIVGPDHERIRKAAQQAADDAASRHSGLAAGPISPDGIPKLTWSGERSKSTRSKSKPPAAA